MARSPRMGSREEVPFVPSGNIGGMERKDGASAGSRSRRALITERNASGDKVSVDPPPSPTFLLSCLCPLCISSYFHLFNYPSLLLFTRSLEGSVQFSLSLQPEIVNLPVSSIFGRKITYLEYIRIHFRQVMIVWLSPMNNENDESNLRGRVTKNKT
jgi:hypothetical protein